MHVWFFWTFELSSVLRGLSPPLQISQSVVPKLHLSVAKLRFWGFSMHSGGTHGIRSTSTAGQTCKEMQENTKCWKCRPKMKQKGSKRWLNYILVGISDNHTKEKPCSEHHSNITQVWGASLGTAMSAFSPSLGSTVMLIPGSLSLMNGRLPVFRSSSRIRRTFLAQTFPWMTFLSSCVQLQ